MLRPGLNIRCNMQFDSSAKKIPTILGCQMPSVDRISVLRPGLNIGSKSQFDTSAKKGPSCPSGFIGSTDLFHVIYYQTFQNNS